MKAIVLAAGIGQRLQPLTNNLPKCLLEVGGKPILDYYFAAFAKCGVDEVVYVVGHQAEKIKKRLGSNYLGVNVRYVQNPVYKTSGSAYSVSLAKDEFTKEPFIISDGDMLFPPELLRAIIDAKPANIMMVENDPSKFSEEPVLVLAEKGVVTAAAKKLIDNSKLVGECIGLFKFGGKAPEALTNGIQKHMSIHGVTSQYDDAYNDVYPNLRVHSISTQGLPWAEIDRRGDLEKARKETYKKIILLAAGKN